MVHKRRNTSTKKGCVSIEACLKTGRPRKQIRLMMMIIIIMMMMMLMLMIINPDFLQIWAFACVWSSTIYLHCKYIRKKATCIQEAWEGKVKAVVKAGWFGFSCSCGCHLPRSRKQTWHETFANKQTFENHVKCLTSYIHLEKRVHICIYIYIYIYTQTYIYIYTVHIYVWVCVCVTGHWKWET